MTVVVSWDEAGYLPPLICSMGRRPPSRPESLRQAPTVRKRPREDRGASAAVLAPACSAR
jgi:hypothetical protein